MNQKIDILDWEEKIRECVIAKGEKEDTPGCYRFWLSNLNGVCDFNGHTDILSILAYDDGRVLAHINTPDDNSTVFEYLDALSYRVVKNILEQVMR